MTLNRLKAMGVAEIAHRSRQEAWKWFERVTVNGNGKGASRSGLKQVVADPGLVFTGRRGEPNRDRDAKILWERFQETSAHRFFTGADIDETPQLLRAKMAAACEQTIAAADEICHGRFNLLGYSRLSFGDPIDWHLDPISGRRSPCLHWSRIKPLDSDTVGDHKVVWELNRHQWLVHLGVAYRLTNDSRYAAAFAKSIRQWLAANPPAIGVNWASSLEAALRIISWSWALFLFRTSEELTPGLLASMLESISLHATRVERYLSFYFAPNTHLTGEALGLYYAGTLFPELRWARRWREVGARVLVEQSEQQILPDGVYFEQSTCYQRYTAEIYLHFLILADRNMAAVPIEVRQRVERLIDFLVAVRRPDGSMPQIGDADDGWLLPLGIRRADDFRGIFSVAAAFFNRPDFAWAADGPTPEALWLLGSGGLNRCESIQPAPPKTEASRVFHDGGYAIMRSGWTKDAHQLIFDVGPLSSPKSGHGHADLLSIQCSVFGEPYLVDAGTYGYSVDPEWRNFFRSSAAHSTVTIDGASQATPTGPFIWQAHPRARLRGWVSTATYDFADAEHDAYRELFDPVTHRRRVVFVKPRYWLVVDDLYGATERYVQVRFQFAPMSVTREPNQWVRARGQNGQALLIRPFASVPLSLDIMEGGVAPPQGWISPEYGRRLAAPVLIVSARTPMPFRVVTLLLPVEDRSASCPDVLQLLSSSIGPTGLIFRRERERVVFRENSVAIFADPPV